MSPNFVPMIVSVGNLLLDPLNYRLFDTTSDSSHSDDENWFVDEQDSLIRELVQNHKVSELKESILQQGWLPIDQIVVRRLRTETKMSAPLFVVVEGNRRVTALKDLLHDFREIGREVPKRISQATRYLSVLLIDGGSKEEQDALANSIMGMRHIKGARPWGGAEAARLIARLIDKDEKSPSEVGALLGISAIEVNRRYRTLMAFQQVREHGRTERRLFTLLGEAIRVRTIRTWLDWNDLEKKFLNSERLELVLFLTSPDAADIRHGGGVISNPQAMRDLRHIIDNDAACEVLEKTKSLEQAQRILYSNTSEIEYHEKLNVAIDHLSDLLGKTRKVPIESVSKLEHLVDLLDSVLEGRSHVPA